MDLERVVDTSLPHAPLSMRLALALLLAVAAGASADAQARFVNACIASAQSDGDLPFDPDQVCGCTASGAMTAGATPADLDRLIDYVDGDTLDLESLPAPMQAVGTAVMESLMGCALSQGMAQALSGAMTEAMSGMTTGETPPASGEAPAKSAPAGAAPAASGMATPAIGLPAGLRTGNGGGTVRTSAPSPGGAIRVIG